MGRSLIYSPDIRVQKHRVHSKIWRDKALSQGLCPLCSKPRSERSKRYCEKHLKDARERMRAKRGFKRGIKTISILKKEPLLTKNWDDVNQFIKDNIDLFIDKYDPILDKASVYIDGLGVKDESSAIDVDSVSSQDWLDNL